MTPIDWPAVDVRRGDMRAELRAFDDATFHAGVTDPPYGISFMGKGWDHGVPGVEYWAEVFRVLKPGAHLAAFSSPRTFHRLAVALEDAGFELRDCLLWLYGTGFPKGLDVAKAIDKRRHDRDDVLEVTRWVRARRDAVGVSNADIDAAFGFNGMAGHWTSTQSQPQVPTLDQVPTLLAILKTTEAELPERIRALIVELNGRKGEFSPNWHAREITGAVEEWDDRQNYAMTSRDGLRRDRAHTADAQAWEGWNTALKPAWEPILLARKPLPNGWTIAATVLEHGTGALNVGACGVDFADDADKAAAAKNRHADFDSDPRGDTGIYGADHSKRGNYDAEARWPANVIVDAEAAALIDGQTGEPVSRVYYCAKASRDERDAGLIGSITPAKRPVSRDAQQPSMNGGEGNPYNRGAHPVYNFHPTVKPLALMRWVCRLITPPGGHVLDPFSGSGSTLCAAMLEGFRATGIDLDTDPETGEPIGYTEIARARAAHWRVEAIRIADGGARPPAVAERDQLDIF